jgi:hypothetical protein
MSRCNPALRWGAGTTREKVVDTAATREMEQRLAAMRRDRDAIDKMWSQPLAEKPQTSTCQLASQSLAAQSVASLSEASYQQPQPKEDKKWITFRSSN